MEFILSLPIQLLYEHFRRSQQISSPNPDREEDVIKFQTCIRSKSHLVLFSCSWERSIDDKSVTESLAFASLLRKKRYTECMENLAFRSFEIDDYDAVTALWRSAGIKLTLSDEKPEIEQMLLRNPDLCFVTKVRERIVGVVMGAFDGRRGFVHHLAVSPEHQRHGVGKAIMTELERRFRKMNVVKITFLIETDNLQVLDFYLKLGYTKRDDLIAVSKTLRESQ